MSQKAFDILRNTTKPKTRAEIREFLESRHGSRTQAPAAPSATVPGTPPAPQTTPERGSGDGGVS